MQNKLSFLVGCFLIGLSFLCTMTAGPNAMAAMAQLPELNALDPHRMNPQFHRFASNTVDFDQVIEMTEARINFHRDLKAMYEEFQAELPTMSDEDLRQFIMEESSNPECQLKKPRRECVQAIESMVTQNLTLQDVNIAAAKGIITRLESREKEEAYLIAYDIITGQPGVLNRRYSDPAIQAITIPGILETLPLNQQRRGERTRNSRWNELAALRLLAPGASIKKIHGVFEEAIDGMTNFASPNFLKDGHLFINHLRMIEAYVFGLIQTPPEPDHWMHAFKVHSVQVYKEQLRSAQAQIKRAQNTAERLTLKRKVAAIEKDIAECEQLLAGPLAYIGEMEALVLPEIARIVRGEIFISEWEKRHLAPQSAPAKKKKKKKKKKSRAAEDESVVEGDAPQAAAREEIAEEDDHATPSAAETKAGPERKEYLSAASPQEEAPEATLEETPRFSKKTTERLHTLYTGRTMKWEEFLKLVTSPEIGFGVEPKGGSYVQILYGGQRSRSNRNHFTLHKPHGPGRKDKLLGPHTLRNIRETLERDFGWTLDFLLASH